jgi:hypothetical protein
LRDAVRDKSRYSADAGEAPIPIFARPIRSFFSEFIALAHQAGTFGLDIRHRYRKSANLLF